MNKIQGIIYPYNSLVGELIRYRSLLEEYEIVAAVAPTVLKENDRDCAFLDEGEVTGIAISYDFDRALDLCDSVIICEYKNSAYWENRSFDKKIIHNILYAMEKGKNIVNTFPFPNSDDEMLKEAADKYGISYLSFVKKPVKMIDEWKEMDPDLIEISELDVPVVVIAGLNEETSKFGIQLDIREQLVRNGFRVTQVGTKHYCELFGFHSFPSIMFETILNEEKKVIYFNQYIKTLEREEYPDVIIIGIPGGMVPLSNRIHERFGLLANEIGYAVYADFMVLTTPFIDIKNLQIDSICNLVHSKLGCGVDCVAVSNNQVNSEDLLTQYRRATYNRFPFTSIDAILNIKNSNNIAVYNGVSKEGRNKIGQLIIDYLVENIDRNSEKAEQAVPEKDFEKIREWLCNCTVGLFRLKEAAADYSPTEIEGLYLQAEIIKKYGICISAKQIKRGAFQSLECLATEIYNNL